MIILKKNQILMILIAVLISVSHVYAMEPDPEQERSGCSIFLGHTQASLDDPLSDSPEPSPDTSYAKSCAFKSYQWCKHIWESPAYLGVVAGSVFVVAAFASGASGITDSWISPEVDAWISNTLLKQYYDFV